MNLVVARSLQLDGQQRRSAGATGATELLQQQRQAGQCSLAIRTLAGEGGESGIRGCARASGTCVAMAWSIHAGTLLRRLRAALAVRYDSSAVAMLPGLRPPRPKVSWWN